MSRPFLDILVDAASEPFRGAGRFAYHHARGKLSADCMFRELLRRGVFPQRGRHLDLGCGQGCLFAWLLAARRLDEQGRWPADWAPPPAPLALRGVELMPRDVERATRAFGDYPVVRIEQGDMSAVDFGTVDVVTLLDALHYLDPARQLELLARIRAALPPGGLFVTRVGDAAAGLSHRLSNTVDHAVAWMRGLRLPRLHCRPADEWVAILRGLGFAVEALPMSAGGPFANVMLVCRAPA